MEPSPNDVYDKINCPTPSTPKRLLAWIIAANKKTDGAVVFYLGKGGWDDLTPAVKKSINDAREEFDITVGVVTVGLKPPPAF
jgi:hypothetical protein